MDYDMFSDTHFRPEIQYVIYSQDIKMASSNDQYEAEVNISP